MVTQKLCARSVAISIFTTLGLLSLFTAVPSAHAEPTDTAGIQEYLNSITGTDADPEDIQELLESPSFEELKPGLMGELDTESGGVLKSKIGDEQKLSSYFAEKLKAGENPVDSLENDPEYQDVIQKLLGNLSSTPEGIEFLKSFTETYTSADAKRVYQDAAQRSIGSGENFSSAVSHFALDNLDRSENAVGIDHVGEAASSFSSVKNSIGDISSGLEPVDGGVSTDDLGRDDLEKQITSTMSEISSRGADELSNLMDKDPAAGAEKIRSSDLYKDNISKVDVPRVQDSMSKTFASAKESGTEMSNAIEDDLASFSSSKLGVEDAFDSLNGQQGTTDELIIIGGIGLFLVSAILGISFVFVGSLIIGAVILFVVGFAIVTVLAVLTLPVWIIPALLVSGIGILGLILTAPISIPILIVTFVINIILYAIIAAIVVFGIAAVIIGIVLFVTSPIWLSAIFIGFPLAVGIILGLVLIAVWAAINASHRRPGSKPSPAPRPDDEVRPPDPDDEPQPIPSPDNGERQDSTDTATENSSEEENGGLAITGMDPMVLLSLVLLSTVSVAGAMTWYRRHQEKNEGEGHKVSAGVGEDEPVRETETVSEE